MTGHIFIDGEIGLHTKPETVRTQISPEYSDYEIHINSNGGDVYDGYQIGNMILNIGKPTLAIVEGMCASIATYIACSADKIVMIPQGSWTIHDPTAQTGGRAEDLIQAALQLNKIKDAIIARYMSKVGKMGITRDQLDAAMAKETTYDAAEAKQWGFADEVKEKLRAVAKIDLTKFKMETLTKQEQVGLFEKLGHKIDALVSAITKKEEKPKAKVIKPKNALELTLTDGTVLVVDASDPNSLQGASVANQDGSPVADGMYETADGMELEIAEGLITEAEEQPTNQDDEPTNDMETVESLKAQIAATQQKLESMPGAQPATKNPAAKSKTEFKAKTEKVEDKINADFQAKVTELERQLAEMKKLTIGDNKPPKIQALAEEVEHDDQDVAFANHVVGFYQSRGFVSNSN